MRLMFAIVYTHSMEEMTRFYRDGLGLEAAIASPFFVELETGPTSLSLLAISPQQPVEFELCFGVDDIEAAVAGLRRRGMEFSDAVRQQEFGKVIHMRDPEGNVVSLLEPAVPVRGGANLSTVIVNSWDFGRSVMFYRDRLGLPVLGETPHWVEFGTGGARIAVHARAERPDAPAHAKQKIACAFEVEDLDAWAEQVAERGTPLATEPTEEQFGTYAEVVDPEGNLVVFREPPAVVPVPVVAAEAFEDDGIPQHVAMRKPVKKRSKAVSRVVVRPEYKDRTKNKTKNKTKNRAKATPGAKTLAKPASNGKPAKTVRVTSTRGGGPERTRLQPKTRTDTKRAKSKPAIGRLRKAERRTLSRKKQAVATASRAHPVKHAAAKQGRRK